MRTPPFLRLAAVLSAVGALVGCADGPPPGALGQLGTLRFEYSHEGACPGCDLGREVLTGSIVTVDVHNIQRRARYAVRSASPNTAVVRYTPRCHLLNTSDCAESLVIDTRAAGDADIEVFDDWTGTVIDRVTVKVRDAALIDTTVRVTRGGETAELRPAEGVFELKVESDVEIVVAPRSADGTALITSQDAIKGRYADERVLAPRPVPGSWASEHARAATPGATTLAIASGTTTSELAFRVVD